MDIQEIIAAVTDGLPADQAAAVKAAIERDAVKTKVAGWKQQQEFDSINTKATQLQAELDGAAGKPGSRAYQKWYNDNYPAIQKLQERMAAYEAKYGTLEAPVTPAPVQAGMTAEDIAKEVDKRIQGTYGPVWEKLLKNTGNLVQKHMLAGRKNPIPFDDIAKTAGRSTRAISKRPTTNGTSRSGRKWRLRIGRRRFSEG